MFITRIGLTNPLRAEFGGFIFRGVAFVSVALLEHRISEESAYEDPLNYTINSMQHVVDYFVQRKQVLISQSTKV